MSDSFVVIVRENASSRMKDVHTTKFPLGSLAESLDYYRWCTEDVYDIECVVVDHVFSDSQRYKRLSDLTDYLSKKLQLLNDELHGDMGVHPCLVQEIKEGVSDVVVYKEDEKDEDNIRRFVITAISIRKETRTTGIFFKKKKEWYVSMLSSKSGKYLYEM